MSSPSNGFWSGLASTGDVQGVIALSLVVGFIALLVLSAFPAYVVAPALAAISAPFLVIMGFYFGSKVASNAAPAA